LASTQELEGALSPGSLFEDLQGEIDETEREIKEIRMMLEQSKVEVDKLTQRNATITSHLQQVQSQIDSVPPPDIRAAYDAALDAQQRLVVMRSQLEKLNSDKSHLERQLKLLVKAQEAVKSGEGGGVGEVSMGPATSVEALIQAQESERQRLSRQMHDGPAQALSNFILQTEIALRLFEIDPEQAREELNSLKAAASSTFQKVRDFIFDLRPMMLDDLGLVPTVKRYADNHAEKSGMEITVTITGSERRLQAPLEVIVFRAIQDLLTNGTLHAQATSMKITMDISESEVRAQVEDNGRGFDPQSVPDDARMVIKALRERMEMLGGSFIIDSAVGQGARISFTVPIDLSASAFSGA
jgi:two-component system sensor histidine kinase DegS